jgi:hypothetical protein
MNPQTYFFCPRNGCINHHPDAGASHYWYHPFGHYHTRAFGTVQRYRCLSCGKTFSDQTFSLNYYLKKNTDFRAFARALNSRASDLFCSRHFGYSSASMQTRVDRLARNGMFMHERVRRNLTLQEPLVADGLESYTASKYFPNNINVLIGKHSEYVYAYNLCHFRRKGKMSDRQKRKAQRVYEGKSFISNEMQIRFSELLHTLELLTHRCTSATVVLHTDENPAYQAAVRQMQVQGLQHIRTSSRAVRDRANPLFAVNYFDRLIRKDLVNHRRKSICFARDDRNMMMRFAWYVCAHNYFKPKRIGSKARQVSERHHSAVVGRQEEVGKLKKMIFDKRFVLSFSQIEGYERQVWLKRIASPLGERGKWNYLPAFAMG